MSFSSHLLFFFLLSCVVMSTVFLVEMSVSVVQISDCGMCFFSHHQHLDPPQVYTFVASLYPCAFSSRAVMLTVKVDRVFGLRLLGLCALVASSVLSRIGLVQVV
ncbi:BnaAnng27840D [Brassica napus]|uniref:(rape) hypothetical protein n=1 Tax=Brassica napus TaxID=3708 RepID=A0A078JM88_BRANA|nr:unnamed protein product [Brassica napus]CDY68623.1 BnaAnng27840D [Brassica napus]